MVAEDSVHDAEDLGAADTVFAADAFAGDGLIRFFLSRGQFAPARFLLGLVSRRAGWFITLEAGIFPNPAAGRKEEVSFIHRCLIMLLAFTGRPQGLDLTAGLVGDDDVLDGMAFLLAAVVLLLALAVVRALDRALGAVHDEGQVGTRRQDLCHRGRLPSWQLLCVT